MTSDNPYAPPKSHVDAPTRRAIERRPVQVVWAIWLIGAGNLLDIPSTIFDRGVTTEDRVFTLMICAVQVALMIQIAKGRNWARVVFLALIALVFIAIPGVMEEYLASPRWQQALDASIGAMFLAALYLLFTHPGSLWFREVE